MARVLIVEDDANNRDVAQRIVQASGHEAIVATDGRRGLELARAQRPDAILMDLLLPEVDGWTLVRSLREEPWAREVPIIAVSALAMQADRARALAAGCSDFLSKPYAPAELRELIARYVPAVTREPRAMAAPWERPATVLVVDDEQANVELVARRLGAIGFETATALSGRDALARAEEDPCDLILLDVMMPGMDGWEVCRELKRSARTAAIPVIFVTARDRAEDVARGFEVGGVDYIPKPFEPLELAARVKSAILTKRLSDDLRARNEELQRLGRSRQELIGMLSHDIRNLANSVIAFLQLVGAGQLTPERPEFGQLLRLSEANVGELLRMVNALLDVYRMEEGRLEAVPQVVPLVELARRSVAQVRAEAVAKGIAVECALPESLNVFVDDGLVVRVFTNLLSNAIRHTPPGGRVRIEADAPAPGSDSVNARVADTGPGIPAEDADHVFDRFYQSARRGRGGSGLGLAFCRLAVELHGGRIRVVNAGAPGARIEFTLPAARSAAQATVASARSVPLSGSALGRR